MDWCAEENGALAVRGLLPWTITAGSARDAALQDHACTLAGRLFDTLPSGQWPTIERTLRRAESNAPGVRAWWFVRPEQVDPLAAPPHRVLVLGLLSAHGHGTVRESAVRHLADGSARALPWLLLRSVDWVDSIADRARRAIADRVTPAHAASFVPLLPLVQRLRGFARASRPLLASIERLVLEQEGLLEREGLHSWDPVVRRRSFQLLRDADRLTERAYDVALGDGDLHVRSLAAAAVGVSPGHRALRERLWLDRSGRIRRLGLEKMVEADDPELRERLVEGLADRTGSARAVARFFLAKRESFDVVAHLRSRLTAEPEVGVIAGLVEVASAAEVERLEPLLEHPRPPIVAATIRALATLDRSNTRELRFVLLDDPRPSVSRAAARSVQNEVWRSDVEFLKRCLESPHSHVRRNALKLLARLPTRVGLPLLVANDDPDLAPLVERRVRALVRGHLGEGGIHPSWARKRWLHRYFESEGLSSSAIAKLMRLYDR